MVNEVPAVTSNSSFVVKQLGKMSIALFSWKKYFLFQGYSFENIYAKISGVGFLFRNCGSSIVVCLYVILNWNVTFTVHV